MARDVQRINRWMIEMCNERAEMRD